MRYLHIYSDEQGESHIEERELSMHEQVYAPPAPPIGVSDSVPAVEFHIITLPPGWYGDWHPVPRRQWFVRIAGTSLIETSDGEKRAEGPGSLSLIEDTHGKGHRSWNTGEDTIIAAVAVLED